MIAIGSLFSGIGGLELGLERAIPGARTVWQVERDPFCRRVLARHWPDARRCDDVRTARDLEPVDVMCGGFPCQDLSVAGKGAGLDGDRSGLWWEFARLIRDLRPRVVVVENVVGLRSRGLGDVLGSLVSLRYDAEWDCLSAAGVGAPHLRRRLFVVAADTDRGELRDLPKRQPWRRPDGIPGPGEAVALDDGEDWPFAGWNDGKPPPSTRGVDAGLFPGMDRPVRRGLADGDRMRALGNAVVPAVAAVVGMRVAEILGVSP
jgi:DNA (cytosine-5)-methyltransferase 1